MEKEEINRITELEIRLTHQDELLEQLNQVVISQQNQIDKLETQLEQISKSSKVSNGSGIKDISLEVPPPHY